MLRKPLRWPVAQASMPFSASECASGSKGKRSAVLLACVARPSSGPPDHQEAASKHCIKVNCIAQGAATARSSVMLRQGRQPPPRQQQAEGHTASSNQQQEEVQADAFQRTGAALRTSGSPTPHTTFFQAVQKAGTGMLTSGSPNPLMIFLPMPVTRITLLSTLSAPDMASSIASDPGTCTTSGRAVSSLLGYSAGPHHDV